MGKNIMTLMPELKPYEQGYLISILRLYTRHTEITDRELPLVPYDDVVAALEKHYANLKFYTREPEARFPTTGPLLKLFGVQVKR